MWFQSAGAGGNRSALCVYPQDPQSRMFTYVPHPRWVGMFPGALQTGMYFQPEGVFDSANGDLEEAVDVIFRDRPCVQISWADRAGEQYAAIVDRQHCVLRLEGRFTDHGGQHIVDEVECEYAGFGPATAAVQYPVSCRYSRHTDGLLTAEDAVVIEVVSLNEPLPESAFQLSDFEGLEGGTAVNWVATEVQPPGENGTLFWDGSAIVVADPAPDVSVSLPEPQVASSRRWLLVGVNLLLISVAAVVIASRRLRRRAGSGS